MKYALTELANAQLLEKIDEEPTDFHDPVTEPVGNDDGRIRAALLAILTCEPSNLVSVRFQLQQAYCAYFNINQIGDDDLFDARTLHMSRDQIKANDAGVDGRFK